MAKIKKSHNTDYKLQATNILPQIYRKITAGFKIFLIFVIFAWLMINVLPSKSSLNDLKTAVLINSNDHQANLKLINQLLKNNQLTEAENLVLANLKNPDDNLLAELTEIRRINNQPMEIRKEIQKWEVVIKEKPDYRDAYFQLAILYYQLYQTDQANKYLTKVLELDPNFEPANNLNKLIKENN